MYFYLTTNVGLISKGGRGNYLSLVDGGVVVIENAIAILNYFSINSRFDLKYNFKKKITTHIGLGPRFDYLIEYNKYFNTFHEEQLKFISYGLIYSFGIVYEFSKYQVGFQIEYNQNFRRIADWKLSDDGEEFGQIKDRTVGLSLVLAYKITHHSNLSNSKSRVRPI